MGRTYFSAPSPTASPLPSAQNGPYAKVTYVGADCSDPLDCGIRTFLHFRQVSLFPILKENFEFSRFVVDITISKWSG